MQAIKNAIWANGLGQVMTVQIRFEVRLDVSKNQTRALSGEVHLDFAHNASSGEVHVCDGSSVNDQPVQWRGCRSGQHSDFVGKTIGVGVEERRAKPIDHEARLGDGAGNNWIQLPHSATGLLKHRSVRMVAMTDDPEQRQRHSQENALFHANENNNEGGRHRQRVLAGALAADGAEAAQIDETHRDREYNRSKSTLGKKPQRAGEEKKD